MRPGLRTVLIAVLVTGSAAVFPAAAVPATTPATTDDRLVLSVDRTTWSPDVTTPLFDPDLVWVPGDVETGTLYARNESGEDATAAAAVFLVVGEGAALAEELHVRTRLGAGPWTDGLRSAVTDLGPGEVLPIGVEVAFDPDATNASQLRTVEIDVVVTLSAAGLGGPGPDDPGAGGQGGPGSLPRTGADLLLPAVVAVAAVLLGSALLLLRERRESRGSRERRPEHG
jgi:hypothetical protein